MKRLIWVEDQPVWRAEYVEAMSQAGPARGWQLWEAFDNAAEALAFIQAHQGEIDGIITDLRIKKDQFAERFPALETPDPHGGELLRRMAQGGITHIPVVAYSLYLLTGSATSVAAEEARATYPFLKAVLRAELEPIDLVNRALAELS
jgi:CheY-like chemotaxis protein